MRIFLLSLLLAGFSCPALAISSTQPIPNVVVTLKPLHALVSGVMENVGEPILLAPPASSEHTFTLKPSQMRDLYRADAIFLVSRDFERFMDKPLKSIYHQDRIKEIGPNAGLGLYPIRHAETIEFLAAKDVKEDEDDKPGTTDYHVWLDPQDAIKIVWYIAKTLSEIDSAHAEIYTRNASNMEKEIDGLDKEIRRMFEAKDKTGADFMPYLTYHDAYQYFERRYNLKESVFILQNPEHTLGAKSVESLQERLTHARLNCIFSEPQFNAKITRELANQTGARLRVVDPLGIQAPMGKEGYFILMRNLASQFAECSRLQGRLRDFGQ
jgi:zinc transport system substrate-binding protein